MRLLRSIVCHRSVPCGIALGILHLGFWWVLRFFPDAYPADMRVSAQTAGMSGIALLIAGLYAGEHGLPPGGWRWIAGLTVAGSIPVLLAYLAGC